MARLCAELLPNIPKSTTIPSYDRSQVKVGILHLGLGAFHRAHQQVYTDDLLNQGGTDWGICGVDLLGPEIRDKLAPQGFLYAVGTMSGENSELRIIGSLLEVVVGPENPSRLLDRMADPNIRIVSATVTEKGYCHDPSNGRLRLDHPDIAHDLANPTQPKTIVGYLVESLRIRRASGTKPFTVMSCDNLFQNGKIAKNVVTDFAAALDPELNDWITEGVAFPCTMVDRITPATTAEDIERIGSELGADDAWPVVCEPFKQWVIEDHFPTGRPNWEKAGAEIVTDVEPFEYMKLRLLNGSHSALSYLGSLAGYPTIADCMADPAYVNFMRRLMDEEVTPTLHLPDGVDVDAYKNSLIERFTNPAIQHRTAQIAMDGSQKLPNRICGPVRERLAATGSINHLALVTAAWIRYATGVDEEGNAFDVVDPIADRLKSISSTAGQDPSRLANEVLSITEVFGEDLGKSEKFVQAVVNWLSSLFSKGAKQTIIDNYGT